MSLWIKWSVSFSKTPIDHVLVIWNSCTSNSVSQSNDHLHYLIETCSRSSACKNTWKKKNNSSWITGIVVSPNEIMMMPDLDFFGFSHFSNRVDTQTIWFIVCVTIIYYCHLSDQNNRKNEKFQHTRENPPDNTERFCQQPF